MTTTTGSIILLRLLDAKRSSTCLPNPEVPGEIEAPMRGTWAHPLTTTNATISLCPRHARIEFQALQSYFHSIARSHF
jgi:hypothetical protein